MYCSAHTSDERARELLLANLDAQPLAEPRLIRFTTGRRKQLWNRNVVCMGLASGFLEPLESTSIHLIQVTIQRLILLFPHQGDVEERRREFNRAAAAEYEYIRDFIILHYHANNRRGEPFWDACRNMSIPDSLRHRIELFRETAGIFCASEDLFQLTQLVAGAVGAGRAAARRRIPSSRPWRRTTARAIYATCARLIWRRQRRQLPGHAEFIARHCAAATARRGLNGGLCDATGAEAGFDEHRGRARRNRERAGAAAGISRCAPPDRARTPARDAAAAPAA